jgi:hypothetical protein
MSRRIRWAGHEARMKAMRNAYRTENSADLGVDGKVLLEWILGNRVGR